MDKSNFLKYPKDKVEKIKKLKGVKVLSNYYAEGGSVKRYNKQIMKKVKKGGITYGASHDNGGIPVKNASTGDMLEVEGGEGIVNKRSMASGKKVKLNGQEMTICEAVSQLNQMEGGVKFSCDDVEDMQFIEAMALGGELERGKRTEKEHIQVLKDLYSKRITPNEAIKKIAEDHLKEDKRYYSKLAKMEGKMAKGGNVLTLLAPNGKPSNLNAEQYHLVRTAEFKKWFGDWERLAMAKVKDPAMDEVTLANLSKSVSKVVDQNGEPLVVYHGTYQKEQFSIFDFTYADLGFHFGTYEQAKERSQTKMYVQDFHSIIKPYFLNIRTLVNVHDIGEWEYPQRYIDMLVSEGLITEKEAEQNRFYKIYDREDNKYVRDFLNNKFDKIGFEYQNRIESSGLSYMVLQPNQIKLADGTNTTFDDSNPDIRFDKGGKTDEEEYLTYAESQKRYHERAGTTSLKDKKKQALDFVKENPELLLLKNGGQIIDCGCSMYDNGGYVDTFVDERIVSHSRSKDNPFAEFGLKKDFRGDAFVRLDTIEKKSINFCDSFPSVCQKNIGIAREDMPQIYEEYIPEYLDFLQDMGITAKLEYDVPVKTLKATQEEISVPRMSRMLMRLLNGYYIDSYGNKINPLKRKLIITRDNYILDGHHRWATMYFLSPNNTIDALRVNADIKDIVPISKNFGMVQFQKFMYGGKVSVEGFRNINGLGVTPNASSVKTLKITRNIFPKAGLKISPLITYNYDTLPTMVFSDNGFQIDDVGKRNLKFNTLRDIKSSLSENLNVAITDYNLSIPDKDKQIFFANANFNTSLESGLMDVRAILKRVNQTKNTPAIYIYFYQYKSASITFSFIFNDKFIELYGDDLDVLEAILNGFSQIFKGSDNMDALVIDGNSTRSRKPRTAKTTQQPTQQGGYWRFKTEQELENELGNDWRNNIIYWSRLNKMDYLLGKKIDNDKLGEDGKPKISGDVVNTKIQYGITSGVDDSWIIQDERLFKFVPETTAQPTQQGGYWRFKTEQELKDDLGGDWRKEVGWSSSSKWMDNLLGQKIDNAKLENGKPKLGFAIDTKDAYGITSGAWTINDERVFTFVPETTAQPSNSQLVPTKELDKKIQEVQDLMNSELFSPDEVVVQQVLIEELKNLNEQKQKSILSNYYSNDLNDLLQLYAQNISKGQRLTMDVACGKETPSGMPSELDETQYTLVRTPQFKAWFGDWEEAYFSKNYSGVSKAINERTGEPLVVYHGKGNMKVEATYFKLTGFPIKYFAENKSYSEWFANNYNAVNILYEFFINVSNPIDLSMVSLDEITPQSFVDLIDALYDYKIQTPLMASDTPMKLWQILRGNPKMLTEIKKNTNYDGFIIYENNPQDIVRGNQNTTKDFIAYENTQYKAADGRNTTFFMDVDDFRFEKGGVIQHTL